MGKFTLAVFDALGRRWQNHHCDGTYTTLGEAINAVTIAQSDMNVSKVLISW